MPSLRGRLFLFIMKNRRNYLPPPQDLWSGIIDAGNAHQIKGECNT